jgi:hypothetical protein
MRKNLLTFAIAAATVCLPLYLSGAPQVSSLAGVLIEKGYIPVKLKRAGNHFYVSCKLNGRSANLLVDTGAGVTLIEPAMLKSLGVPLTKVDGNWYGFLGLAAESMNTGEIKDFQVGPYQAGAHRVGAWDFSSYRYAKGAPRMEGILGIDFLHRHQAVIDCFQMDLFLKSPSAPSASATLSAGLRAGAATEIPIQITHRGLTVPAQISGRSGYLAVDTGMRNTLLSQHAIAGLDLHVAALAGSGKRTGIGGTIRYGVQDIGKNVSSIQRAYVDKMELGNFGVPSQWVVVGELPYPKSSGTDSVFFGYLGQDLLAYYVGIIDCAALKLFLRFDPVIDDARRRSG